MLGELIKWLEQQDPGLSVSHGFGAPYSYRGYYYDCGFEPVENTTFGEMLGHATDALGKTFEGWKGGDYTMESYTECWIAEEGTTNADKIGPTLMRMWAAHAA